MKSRPENDPQLITAENGSRSPRSAGSAWAREKHFAEVLGRRMAYVERGAGHPVMFLHGNPTSSFLWRRVLPYVEAPGRRLIAPDLVGMGDSDKIPAGAEPDRYRFASHARYLDAFIDQVVGTEPLTLVLHDWGGALGFDWAYRHQQRVRAIAYMETFVAPLTLEDLPESFHPTLKAVRSSAGEALVLDENMFIEKMLPDVTQRTLSADEMAEYRRPFLEAGDDRWPTLQWPREVPLSGEPADVHDRIAAYSAWLKTASLPKLFIDAEPGVFITGRIRRLAISFPNQHRVVVRGLHFLQEDSPDKIGRAIAGWLDRHDQSLQDHPGRRSARNAGFRPSVAKPPSAEGETDFVHARAPAPQERAPDERPIVDSPPLHDDRQPGRDESGNPPRGGLRRRHRFALMLGLALFVPAATAVYLYWDNSRHFESTDDAYIAARQFAIQPKVSGYITAVPVTDNQHVAAGDVLARIDDRDYRIAVEQARAQVANAEANISNIDAQINVQQAQVNASQAQVEQAQAALVFAQQQADRYEQLAQKGSGTVQNAQQWDSQLRERQAAVASAQANLKLAQRQIETLKAQRNGALANLAQTKAQRDQVDLNLSYTTVRAAQAGRVVSLSGAVGQFAQAGTTLTMFVPRENWVTANFKETQLDAMRPGQPVTLTIDAYPDRIRGHVASVQPGSGPAFSLLPPENATGNWVKIVQRVPVKIVMDDPPTDVALGPGMSVETTVRVSPSPSLYERLRAWL